MFSNPVSDYSGNPLGICRCDDCTRRSSAPASTASCRRAPTAITRSSSATRRGRCRRRSAPHQGPAPEGGPGGDLARGHRHGVLGVQHRRAAPPAAVAVRLERQREPRRGTPGPRRWRSTSACRSSISRGGSPWSPGRRSAPGCGRTSPTAAAPLRSTCTARSSSRTGRRSETARPIFAWLKDHQEYYVGQVPARGSCSCATRSPEAAHRGVFRLLSEQHLPFGVVDNLGWMAGAGRPRDRDGRDAGGPRAVGPPGRAPAHRRPHPAAIPGGGDGEGMEGPRRGLFPRARPVDVPPSAAPTSFMYGEYRELKGSGPLTFIPPSMYGPPELVHVDWKDTDCAGPGGEGVRPGRGGVAPVGDLGRSTTGTAPRRTPG